MQHVSFIIVDETLRIDDAVDVLEALIDAQNDSYVLGLSLRLPPNEIDGIHSTYSYPRHRLLHVIIAFLKQVHPRPTWKVIVDALRSPIVNLPVLAATVEEAHFPDCTSTCDRTATGMSIPFYILYSCEL